MSEMLNILFVEIRCLYTYFLAQGYNLLTGCWQPCCWV